MDKASMRMGETRHPPTLRRDSDHSGSRAQQSASPAKDDRTQRTKRKASPENKTQRKRARVPEVAESSDRSEDNGRVRGGKRKVGEDGEGPSKQTKKRRQGLDFTPYDRELVSSSVDAGRESSSSSSSSSSPLEGCSTSVEDVSSRGWKRKAAADGESRSKKQKCLELRERKKDLSVDARRAQFEARYKEQNELGKGGCGSVFAGYCKADHLPVAIKHVPKDKVLCKHVDQNGKQLSVEVAVMMKLSAKRAASVGMSAAVSLLDWYDLGEELILVLERPVPSEDLLKYIETNGGTLQEEEAMTILQQLLDAAVELQNKHIFHRDIKIENILIETGSNVPRVRLIDFGLSCFVKKRSFYHVFYGTSAHIPPEWYSRCTYTAGPTTVWQLGVVLFEMLHSQAPFETTKFLRNELEISCSLSEGCQDFLRTCLTKSPEQRSTLKELQRHPWLQ